MDSDLAVSKFRCKIKGPESTQVSSKFPAKNTQGAPLMTSAARTSFGCWGVISVEGDFSLEMTGASWV